MKKPRINKHRYGWCIQFTQHLFLDLDINNWWFLPNLEFDRRPGTCDRFIFSFLCVSLTFYRWRFDDKK